MLLMCGVRESVFVFACSMCLVVVPQSHAQIQSAAEEIPLERCDYLPVVTVKIDKTDMRFLVDTAATSMLNLKSFSSGRSKRISITSWSGKWSSHLPERDLAINTGLRKGSEYGLTWDMVDWKAGMLNIPRTKNE